MDRKLYSLRDNLLESEFRKRLDILRFRPRDRVSSRLPGSFRSRHRGGSLQFADYRDYTSGDDLRYVDWKAFGRHEKLIVKRFEAEEQLNLNFLLDRSESMAYGSKSSKVDLALKVCAALGYVAMIGNHRVSVFPFSNSLQPKWVTTRGRQSISSYLRYLNSIPDCGGSTAFAESINRFIGTATSRGIAVVISDFLTDEVDEGLKKLIGQGFDLIIVQLLDPEELEPDLSGNLKLLDSETGSTRDIDMSQNVINQYKIRLEAHMSNIRDISRRYSARYIFGNTDESPESIVLQTMRFHHIFQ